MVWQQHQPGYTAALWGTGQRSSSQTGELLGRQQAASQQQHFLQQAGCARCAGLRGAGRAVRSSPLYSCPATQSRPDCWLWFKPLSLSLAVIVSRVLRAVRQAAVTEWAAARPRHVVEGTKGGAQPGMLPCHRGGGAPPQAGPQGSLPCGVPPQHGGAGCRARPRFR